MESGMTFCVQMFFNSCKCVTAWENVPLCPYEAMTYVRICIKFESNDVQFLYKIGTFLYLIYPKFFKNLDDSQNLREIFTK